MKSTCAIKEMELSNLNGQNVDSTKDSKSSCTNSSNAQMDKASLKAELSFSKKHVGDCERLKNERDSLK